MNGSVPHFKMHLFYASYDYDEFVPNSKAKSNVVYVHRYGKHNT